MEVARGVKDYKGEVQKWVIEPLEKMELREGEEFTLTIVRLPEINKENDAFSKSRGGWKELIDCEQLKRNIYADRLIHTRPEAKL